MNRLFCSALIVAICFVAVTGGSVRAGAVIVDIDFDNATLNTGPPVTITDNDTGFLLTNFSTTNAPSLSPGSGVGSPGTTALNNGSNAAMVSGWRTIDSQVTFSMFAKYTMDISTFTSNGGLSFGWTQASGEYNPYSGTGVGVSLTDHVLVGVTKTSSNTFRLAAVNGAHGSLGTGPFGTASQPLVLNDWYRLSGTVLYDSTSTLFTFSDIRLDDMGADGTASPTTILSGTTTLSPASFGTAGRVVFATNRDRGFVLTDDYSAVGVPEPTAFALTALGLMMGLCVRGRRRRR